MFPGWNEQAPECVSLNPPAPGDGLTTLAAVPGGWVYTAAARVVG